MEVIKGFSKLSKKEKLDIVSRCTSQHEDFFRVLNSFQHPDLKVQEKLDSFSENTLSNFPIPYGVVPNVMINNKIYVVPVAIEESSVVAAASSASGFWAARGGFRARILNVVKTGQVHFLWKEDPEILMNNFQEIKDRIKKDLSPFTKNMEKRGGGIEDIQLVDLTDKLEQYYQLSFSFDTVDSMGANFINTCLEEAGKSLKSFVGEKFSDVNQVEIIMAILSNYVPDSLVNVEVRCDLNELDSVDRELDGRKFAEKFIHAVKIAEIDVSRAVTHNKGIMNGVDAVVIATGNDFRAVEAGVHAFAAKDGNYKSLSYARIEVGEFVLGMNLPLAVGSVGGLTGLHPLAKQSFKILGQPDARELMMIIATLGLANHFAAIRSLITKGIQKGHMKMHLVNILNFLEAGEKEKEKAINFFEGKTVSFSDVEKFLDKLKT